MFTGKRILGRFALTAVAVQILLPALIFVCLLVVKNAQHNKLAGGINNNTRFEQIRISKADAGHEYMTGDEFTFNGMQYDIKSVVIVDDYYVITVLPDQPETTLNNVTSGIFDTHGSAGPNDLKVLPFFFLYFESPNSWQPLCSSLKTDYQLYHHAGICNHKTGILLPPPRFSSSHMA